MVMAGGLNFNMVGNNKNNTFSPQIPNSSNEMSKSYKSPLLAKNERNHNHLRSPMIIEEEPLSKRQYIHNGRGHSLSTSNNNIS